jgi:hypothetical protein
MMIYLEGNYTTGNIMKPPSVRDYDVSGLCPSSTLLKNETFRIMGLPSSSGKRPRDTHCLVLAKANNRIIYRKNLIIHAQT